MEDSYIHKGKRKILVEYLRENIGIENTEVLSAMAKVPRHLFLDSIFLDFAYEDRSFTIDANQTISHPSTVAEQTELLNVKSGEKLLEIGTGCGYQTAILVSMGANVYTIERQKKLYEFSKKILEKLKLSPIYQHYGDGFIGLPSKAPFDKIIVTCGADTLPKNLINQLRVGGKMVIPIAEDEEHYLYRFTKLTENEIEREQFGRYKFVPMLGDTSP